MCYLNRLGLFLAVMCNVFMLQAQTSFYAGPVAGYYGQAIINQNNYGQREMDYIYTDNYDYGLMLGADFGNKHLIQLELVYKELGQNYRDQFSGNLLEKELELKYLHIPLTYKFVVAGGSNGLNKGTRFFVGAGPYVGLLLSADMDLEVNDNDRSFYDFTTFAINNNNLSALNELMPDRGTPAYKDLYNSIDIGAVFGLGFQSFIAERFKITFEIRSGISLTDINATSWRLNNTDGQYNPSYNWFGGASLGAVYYMGGN